MNRWVWRFPGRAALASISTLVSNTDASLSRWMNDVSKELKIYAEETCIHRQ